MAATLLLLARADIERLLDLPTCIAAVEHALRRRAEGAHAPSGVLGVHVAAGVFHLKAAALELDQPFFAAKVNANFPGNPAQHGLPTVQGVLVLFDAARGEPLAVMDSAAITTLRTAAASAVAAKHLARPGARTMTIVGCGVQARAHLSAMRAVLPLERVHVVDADPAVAAAFAAEMRAQHGIAVAVATTLDPATLASEVIVTCTSSRAAFLSMAHVAPGTFIAADNEHKQEIEPALLRAAAVVVDDLEQCATMGDLHHAIAAGVMTRPDVRATLGEVIAGRRPGRRDPHEIVVFDSTGVALEDVAAAASVWTRARAEGAGLPVALAG